MLDLNEVKLRGTICGEPKYVATQNNSAMARFSLAVHRKEPSKALDYLNVIAWGNNADMIKERYHDGSSISLIGSIQNNRYKSSTGEEKRTIRIVLEKFDDEGVGMDEDLYREEVV